MKVKKIGSTYGKKKKHKTESIKPRVVIHVYNISQVSITNNVTNKKKFLGNSTSSWDEFEKLKNIPSYQPFVNVSSKRNNFFQRQGSTTFYDSNVTSTLSSSSSVRLFKDAYSKFTSPLSQHSNNEEYGSPSLCKNTSVASTNVYLESYANEAPNRSSNDMFFDEDEENLSAPITSKEEFLLRCGVDKPTPFEDVFTTKSIKNFQKIGEGGYSEVFMLNHGKEETVLKIIPIGGEKNINGTVQKKFDEILSELITTEELSLLRDNTQFNTTGFCQLKQKLYIQGSYPPKLLDLWHKFYEENKSDNECPDKLDPDNCFLVLEQEHAGQPVGDYEFNSAMQAYSVFLQVVFSLAVAEGALEFEHRDLHIGNILVKETTDSNISFTIENNNFKVPSFGVKATIIDFTFSRISFKGKSLYYDLAEFKLSGDPQLDIHRMMRDDLNNIWKSYQPKTNVRWLHDLLSNMMKITKNKCKSSKSKQHHEYLRKLEFFMSRIQDFASAFNFSKYLLETLSETVKFVVNK